VTLAPGALIVRGGSFAFACVRVCAEWTP
jgi:hypothetical protein